MSMSIPRREFWWSRVHTLRSFLHRVLCLMRSCMQAHKGLPHKLSYIQLNKLCQHQGGRSQPAWRSDTRTSTNLLPLMVSSKLLFVSTRTASEDAATSAAGSSASSRSSSGWGGVGMHSVQGACVCVSLSACVNASKRSPALSPHTYICCEPTPKSQPGPHHTHQLGQGSR